MAKAIWESVWDLLTWNAYEKWKSVWELWLVWSWAWAWVYVWRKGVKLWMKKIAKLRINKEILVKNPKVKQTIKGTNNKFSEIIPKKELDFEKLLVEDIAKLWDKDRIEASRFYLKRDIWENQQKAILEAHNIWRNRDWVWIYNYSQSEIAKKVKILKEAWFSNKERRILLEKGVCARISDKKLFQLDIKWNNLEEKVNYLFELAKNTRKDYDNLLTNIWKDTNANRVLNSEKVPLKNKENVISKIKSEYEWKYPERVRDILRWSIVYDDISDLKRWLQKFKDSDDIQVIHVTNRLWDINTNDILLNIRFPNWFVAEVQLHIRETLYAKEIWLKLDKSIIDLNWYWNDIDYQILEKLKKWEYWWRILNKDIKLPKNWEIVNTHSIYEIIRGLEWKNLTIEEELFLENLKELQNKINLYARKQYEIRTWKKFIP